MDSSKSDLSMKATGIINAKRTRLLVCMGILVVFIYFGSYCILSATGRYIWTQSGEGRYATGLSVMDLKQWQPKFAFWQIFRTIDGKHTVRANLLGLVYSPLIFIDQQFVHPTTRLFQKNTDTPKDVNDPCNTG
ncbi:MAG: hypothetical protein ABSG97_08745 [Sedimentisphaerales bacterium]|jgi:hypothetical protein